MKNYSKLIMVISLILLTSCKEAKQVIPVKVLTSGISKANMDTTANPLNDFYRYATGGWMDKHPLTAEYSRFGTFDQLGENNKVQLKSLITEIAKGKHQQGTIKQKIGDLYNMGMDTVTIEKQGAAPIQPELNKIAQLKTIKELPVMLGEMHLSGNSPFFGIFGEADPKNSKMNIAWIWQTGLGIGDRDYYLEANMKSIRDEYVVLLTHMFKISGYSKIVSMEGKEEQLAKDVLKLETELAKVFAPKELLRDPNATYNMKTIDELQKMIPNFDFKSYLNTMHLESLTDVNVGQLKYIKGLNNILGKTNIQTIKAYLAWNVINSAASYLSKEFVAADFNFYGKILSGKESDKPRWKKVIETVDGSLGEAVGQMYVEKYFPAEAKVRMEKLVANLKVAMEIRFNELTWMSDSTKAKAIDKLHAIIVKVGYPDKWRDYSALEIKNDSYYANILRSRIFENNYQLNKIGKPVDPTLWGMTPQTVNAYYNPSTNEICFPAGILQPPFFDMNADDAVNYGAIGVVIGHEMTHGFDDAGRYYDKFGNLTNWWSKEDSINFAERSKVLVDYFSSITVLPELKANGEFTLGENIADNGGLNISYVALQKAIKEGTVKNIMDGFTPEQRFFLAYAMVWGGNIRDAEISRRTKEDPHSLGKWRVNGALPHIAPFLDAFKIKEGDGMWLAPEKRAQIW
jgi:putative endopeptidase